MDNKITCNIQTPDKVVYDGQVESIILPAFDGEVGFLVNHTPLISELGIGEVQLKDSNNVEYIAVHGGFVEIRDNYMSILTDYAYTKDEISIEETEQELAKLVSSEKPTDIEERLKVDSEIKKLKVNLKLASR